MPNSPERSDSEHPAVSAARELVVELRSAIDDPEGIKATLLELAQGDDGARVKEFLEGQLKLELLGERIVFSDQVLYFQSKSVLDIVWLMLQDGDLGAALVGVAVMTFSVLFPLETV